MWGLSCLMCLPRWVVDGQRIAAELTLHGRFLLLLFVDVDDGLLAKAKVAVKSTVALVSPVIGRVVDSKANVNRSCQERTNIGSRD